jgi:hypothetical protein
MLADLGQCAVRFLIFVAGATVMVVLGTLLVVVFPIALGLNLLAYDDPRRAWHDTLEIFLPRRRRREP